MPSLKTIRKRISSVKATEKITRAMKMVAGARLSRAQQRITALRPYALKVHEILEDVAAAMVAKQTDIQLNEEAAMRLHPLLQRRPEKKVLFVVMSGDRGLSGAFNANVNKATERAWKQKEAEGAEVVFATTGRKAREYLARRQGVITKDFPRMLDGLDMAKASQVTDYVVRMFEKGEVDAVYLVYNEFKSAMTQKPMLELLLPPPERSEPAAETGAGVTPSFEFDFEPSERAVLERLVPMYVEISVYRALLETQAGFFGAQMTAMDSATRNASDMISRLSLQYNRARQAAITKELMEIIGGAEALKG